MPSSLVCRRHMCCSSQQRSLRRIPLNEKPILPCFTSLLSLRHRNAYASSVPLSFFGAISSLRLSSILLWCHPSLPPSLLVLQRDTFWLVIMPSPKGGERRGERRPANDMTVKRRERGKRESEGGKIKKRGIGEFVRARERGEN